jgi:hypothetical protein
MGADMKSYMTQRQWRLVGKAWEIRAYLRAQSRENGEVKLADFLEKRAAVRYRPGSLLQTAAY